LILVTTSGCDQSLDYGGQKVSPFPDYSRPAYWAPIWSPDGATLGFNHIPLDSIYADSSGRHHYVFRDTLSGFWMVDSSGANLRRALTYYIDDPSWSPNGEWIAYGYNGDIWRIQTNTAGIDSTSDQRLTFQGHFFGPTWDPLGGMLLVFRPVGGAVSGLYRMGAGGGPPAPIGEDGWREPSWSPDRARILFVGAVGPEYGIGSSDSLGAAALMIRSDLQTPELPRWSPDGSKIAFVDRSPVTQYQNLWVMDADGSNLRMASPDAVGRGFAWSPDGTRIAYVRHNLLEHSYQNGTVWIVELAGGSLRQLTFSGPQPP
jgi:Tol biopolymer transport system component